MLSWGGINGDSLNTYEVNGGRFTLEAAAATSLTFDIDANPVHRAVARAAADIAFDAYTSTSKRMGASGKATMTVSAELAPSLRQYLVAQADIELSARANILLHYMAAAPFVIVVPHEPREMLVVAQHNTIIVPADPPPTVPPVGNEVH